MTSRNADVGRRRLSRRQLAGCLVVVTFLGVASALMLDGGIGPTMRTDAASYEPGDRVDLRLRNGPRSAGYNLCFAFADLQRHGAQGWTTVPADLGPPTEDLPTEAVFACPAQMSPLLPLGRRRAEVHLPSDLPEGEYRLVHRLEIGGDDRAVPTDPFTVGVVD